MANFGDYCEDWSGKDLPSYPQLDKLMELISKVESKYEDQDSKIKTYLADVTEEFNSMAGTYHSLKDITQSMDSHGYVSLDEKSELNRGLEPFISDANGIYERMTINLKEWNRKYKKKLLPIEMRRL